MLYLLGFLTSLQIVIAQVLWKIGVEKVDFVFTTNYLLSAKFLKVFASPYIISGILLYGFATVCFFALLSKFPYSHTQTIVVVSSLILTYIVARLFFAESISMLGLIGIVLLLIGAVLVTKF